ncbi:MAG: hypothetical protein ACK4V2_05315 [Pseudomonadota bacterium]|nr:hypothetical protein [Alphaproteobacteria bacterium]
MKIFKITLIVMITLSVVFASENDEIAEQFAEGMKQAVVTRFHDRNPPTNDPEADQKKFREELALLMLALNVLKIGEINGHNLWDSIPPAELTNSVLTMMDTLRNKR